MPGRPFEKGNPGGPGRPKGSGYIRRCAEWADKFGFAFLERVAEGSEKVPDRRGNLIAPSLQERLTAATYIIERGYGKPRQCSDISIEGVAGEVYRDWTDADLDAEALRILKELADKAETPFEGVTDSTERVLP